MISHIESQKHQYNEKINVKINFKNFNYFKNDLKDSKENKSPIDFYNINENILPNDFYSHELNFLKKL